MGRQKSRLQRTYSVELFDNEEYNSTKLLSDVDRHMQTLLSCTSIKEGNVEKQKTVYDLDNCVISKWRLQHSDSFAEHGLQQTVDLELTKAT